MPRPTRKHPGFDSMAESPQGGFFVHILGTLLGDDLVWRPLERTKDGHHVFMLRGARGVGLLVESKEGAEEEYRRREYGFRCELLDTRTVIQLELVTYRWDAQLSASKSGDHSLIVGPGRQRSKVRRERNRAVGSRRDTLRLAWLPPADVPSTLAGVPYETVAEIARRKAAVVPLPS